LSIKKQHVCAGRLANTLGLHSRAAALFAVSSTEDVHNALKHAATENLPLIPLGEGSNVVLPPQLRAVVVQVADDSLQLTSESRESVTLRVGAGKNWHTLVQETLELGFYGLENLALIPGLVGAAPVQNIGAYGRELAAFVVAVHGFDLLERRAVSLSARDCHFGYRDSIFKHAFKDRYLIMSLELELQRDGYQPDISYPALAARLTGQNPSPQSVFDAVVALRRERLPDPSSSPNAGSFFKNPILSVDEAEQLLRDFPDAPCFTQSDGSCKTSAAWLIDQAGLRGHAVGGARVSEQHALVITTDGHATQADVLQLAASVQSAVAMRFGVALEIEPRVYD
jgi:UDP-N-acetylmuramate dehydrogenase